MDKLLKIAINKDFNKNHTIEKTRFEIMPEFASLIGMEDKATKK